jgi:5-methyltetrahydropteroyltriglutamate--homocysteine methyltransferase
VLAPAELLDDGVLADDDGVLEDELDGALLEPLAALPLGCDGAALELELDEPPEAGALGEAEDELELLSLLLMSTDAEPEVELDGVLGVVVAPADEDDEPEGGVVFETVRSPSRSQPVSNPAPSARDTATARVESFMWPPWLGYHVLEQGSGHLLNEILPTTVVGSYPQPGWLIDRAKLGAKVPRVREPDLWRIAPPLLEEAQNDATLIAIRDMERAGIDIITDGEMRRESYSNRFATALEGIDIDNPGSTINRSGQPIPVPRVAAAIRRRGAVEVPDVTFLRKNTSRRIKITLPGPFTMAQQAQDDYYKDEEALAMAFAAAVNEEIRDLKAAGADVVQIDEPWLQARPERAVKYGVKAINRALQGIGGTTIVHLCFGYAAAVKDKPTGYSFLPQLEATTASQISIEAAQPRLDLSVLRSLNKTVMVGVIDLGTSAVETPQQVAGRIRAALKHVPAERLVLAPDCGMKYLTREAAFGKLKSLAEGAAVVRKELA